jgi:hypothetical protein
MKIVIDTSIILAVITNEPHKTALIEATQYQQLLAPSSVHWEIGNAFSAMFKRNRITLNQAVSCLEIYRSISLKYLEIDLNLAMKIAFKHNIYAYDAYLIACAQQENCPILSLDKGLIKAAITEKIAVIEV